MKKFNLWALLAISAMFVFSACNKEESVNAPTLQDPSIGRNSGVVPDASATIAKVPMYVSSEFVQNGGSFSSYVHPNNRGGNNQSKGVRAVRDVTPPTVTITSPSNGATVSGTVFISINASDDYALASVTLSVNGTVLTSWTTAPFSTSWTPATDGNYTLTATAKDKNSNSASHSIVVSRSTNSTSTGGGGTTTTPPTTLPSSFLMATPPIMDQGGEGSCLSMALISQRNIEQYYKTNATSYSTSTNILSPEFLYNYTKVASGCGSGAAMSSSLEFIRKRGICTWNSLPYDYSNGCDTININTSMKSEAINYTIPTYHYLIASDKTAVKTSLASKHPVSFTFQMDSNFYNAYPGYIWNSRGTLMYTHALTLVGYDDAKGAYKAINAWGTSWGDQGFIWIDYDFFGSIVGYVYAMN